MNFRVLFLGIFGGLCFISTAQARSVCQVDLIDHWTNPIQTFIGHGPNRSYACSEAKWDCRKALEDRQRSGRSGQNCVERPSRPIPKAKGTCKVALRDHWLNVIKVFRAHERTFNQSCQTAKWNCEREREYRHDGSTCDVISRTPPVPGQTFSCQYNLLDGRDEDIIIKKFRGTGHSQRNACRKALKRCERLKERRFPSRCERAYFEF
jgi:hypothetical protein